MSEIQELLGAAKIHRESGDGEKLLHVFRQLQIIQPDERNWKVAAACALGELGQVEDTLHQIKAVALTAHETTMVIRYYMARCSRESQRWLGVF